MKPINTHTTRNLFSKKSRIAKVEFPKMISVWLAKLPPKRHGSTNHQFAAKLVHKSFSESVLKHSPTRTNGAPNTALHLENQIQLWRQSHCMFVSSVVFATHVGMTKEQISELQKSTSDAQTKYFRSQIHKNQIQTQESNTLDEEKEFQIPQRRMICRKLTISQSGTATSRIHRTLTSTKTLPPWHNFLRY